MRRVLVPLDGTDFAAAILPDARRLAGRGGRLILIRDVTTTSHGELTRLYEQQWAAEAARDYLDTVAQVLRTEGVRVQTQPLVMGDAAVAIDEGAEHLHADMIAASTHGRSAAERWQSGSVAWRALLRSTVPVLLRHVDPEKPFAGHSEPDQRRLMVPLDGSALAERALPLAQELAGEWNASIWLVRVVSESSTDARNSGNHENAEVARAYLYEIAHTVPGEVHSEVFIGPTEETLVRAVDELSVTDIVMTSHGRTAVSRAIVGSIVDRLIHDLRCPIVVVPVLAAVMGGRAPSTQPGSCDPVEPRTS
jgi:nucleotide-binding universal stress UspA family protein